MGRERASRSPRPPARGLALRKRLCKCQALAEGAGATAPERARAKKMGDLLKERLGIDRRPRERGALRRMLYANAIVHYEGLAGAERACANTRESLTATERGPLVGLVFTDRRVTLTDQLRETLWTPPLWHSEDPLVIETECRASSRPVRRLFQSGLRVHFDQRGTLVARSYAPPHSEAGMTEQLDARAQVMRRLFAQPHRLAGEEHIPNINAADGRFMRICMATPREHEIMSICNGNAPTRSFSRSSSSSRQTGTSSSRIMRNHW